MLNFIFVVIVVELIEWLVRKSKPTWNYLCNLQFFNIMNGTFIFLFSISLLFSFIFKLNIISMVAKISEHFYIGIIFTAFLISRSWLPCRIFKKIIKRIRNLVRTI